MKNSILLVIKGFVMGIANIIPGVSGGTLAIILGIYEQFISSISHFFKNIRENIKFLLPILIGIVLSIISMSNVIDYSYKHYPIPTTLFFVGLVLGGIPLLYGKVKGKKDSSLLSNIIIFLLTFSLVIFMAFADKIFNTGSISFSNMSVFSYILLFIVGIITSATMVIPGVSGSLVLMLLGYYYPIIKLIKNLSKFQNLSTNLPILIVFGLGVLLGIILISKLIEYLFKKHQTKTYYGVLGFIFASIAAIPISTVKEVSLSFNIIHILIGVVMLVIGIITSYKLGEK